ncbi:hypothetical protein GGI35DRAFT_484031 [Trichoderma velutinum]
MAALGDQAASKPQGFGLSEEVEQPILTVATDCESNFKKSLQLLSSEGEIEHEIIMKKLEKRFLDWAAYLGVFAGANGDLDQRLKHYPQYRDLILLMLDMLNKNLFLTIADPSESSSDEASNESSDDEADRKRVELDGIQRSRNELDRLAIHIRQSFTSSLDARVSAFASRNPVMVSSFKIKAILAVNALPEASKSLRKYLSKSMMQRHTKLLYWQFQEKKLPAGRRRDGNSRGDPAQSRRESSPLPAKELLLQPLAVERDSTLPKPEPSKVSAAEAQVPSARRAGASAVLASIAKFPIPPQFEEGEFQKPCPLCQKIFLKANFADDIWWRCHVNEDLLPFACISSSCLQAPTFASRSDWRAHIERDHGGFWRRGSPNPIGNENRSLNPNSQQTFDASRSADICPLCCLPLDGFRRTSTSIPLPVVSSASQVSSSLPVSVPPEPKNDFEGTKKGTITVPFDVLKDEGKQLEYLTARGVTDSGAKIVAPMNNPVMNSTMDVMMNTSPTIFNSLPCSLCDCQKKSSLTATYKPSPARHHSAAMKALESGALWTTESESPRETGSRK